MRFHGAHVTPIKRAFSVFGFARRARATANAGAEFLIYRVIDNADNKGVTVSVL